MAAQLAFHNTQFNIVSRANQLWLTSSDLATALQYKSEKSITNLFNKNIDEFSPGMSEVIESVTSGNLKSRSRIFSLRGAHLIAMFARTQIAKEFRRWVLDILDREVGEPVAQPIEPELPIADGHANRTEVIYYQDFKPIFCRTLTKGEIVISHESMMQWLKKQGLMFFTRDELKKLTHEQWLALVA